MIYFLNNQEIFGQFKTADGTTYPSNWLDLSNDKDKQDLGIICLEEFYDYDINYDYQNYKIIFEDDFENKKRIWRLCPR